MTDTPRTPPPGYIATPPTQEGWYKVWHPAFHDGEFRVKEVWQSRSCELMGQNLCVNGPFLVSELDWHWGPRIEFP